jgi:serine/threonine-protein kinase
LHSSSRAQPEGERGRRSSVLPLVGALLVAGGLIALIAWQVGPSAEPHREAEAVQPQSANASPAGEAERKPSPADSGAPPSAVGEQPPGPNSQSEPPAYTAEAQSDAPHPGQQLDTEQRAQSERPLRRALPQQIHLATNPPGALVTLDRDPAVSCHTPCFLEGLPGRHSVSISMAGYQDERREVMLGESAEELPLINLRKLGGTLMLSSTPPGASIIVNGNLRRETTPARLDLAPGSYSITIEKDGVRKTVQVEIRNGVTKYQPVDLGGG